MDCLKFNIFDVNVNENYLMPAVAGVLGIANRYNPLSKGSQNYNPDLQNQIDMLKASGHLGGGDPSGPYKITSGPLAGKNLVSAFGTNDYGRMLDKKLASLVNKNTCQEIGKILNLDKHIVTGNKKKNNNTDNNDNNNDTNNNNK